MRNEHASYGWEDAEATCAHSYLLPLVEGRIRGLFPDGGARILDIGCGNGYLAGRLAAMGHEVVGVDVSPDGIAIARETYPGVRFEACSVYDEAFEEIANEPADCVVSLEVAEHLVSPKILFERSYNALRPGGHLILSTPYHGYLKNLAISLIGGWDRHFTVDWEGGHIKFFSKRTLTRMAAAAGFGDIEFSGVGRLPGLWKSVVIMGRK